ERQKHPQATTDEINPEVTDCFHLPTRDSADEGNRERNPNRRRNEVVISKPGHLREITHRCFAGVGLPVGVGRERHRSVEGHMRGRDCGEFLRIEWQQPLHSLHQVKEQHGHHAEQQHGNRIFCPGHLVLFVHSRYAIQQSLNWPQYRIQERMFLAEYARHKNTQGFSYKKHEKEKEQYLKPSIDCHIQNFSGQSSAYSRYTPVRVLMASMITDSNPITSLTSLDRKSVRTR